MMKRRNLPYGRPEANLRRLACALRLLLLALVAIGTPCPSAWRQYASAADGVQLNPDLTLDQYHYRQWSVRDGLPSDRVLDILQTADGYLWLATERGLARFDGMEFTNFNRSNTAEFVTNQITALHEGRDGTLWIATHRGGLIRCRPGQPPDFQRFAELEGYAIHCLCEDRNGTLWIGTEVETWTQSEGNCSPRRDAPLNVMAMCKDYSGNLWLGASIWAGSKPESLLSSDVQPQPGLYRVDDDCFYRLTEADGFPQTKMESTVRALCSDRSGALWIGTAGEGLLHYRDGRCNDYSASVGLQVRQYLDIHHDRGGQLWVSTFASGSWRILGDNAAKVPIGLRPGRCIAEDRDGNIWFGAGDGGLRCISNPELLQVDLGVRGHAVRCVLEDRSGNLWFGSGSPAGNKRTGLHCLRVGVVEHLGSGDGLPTHLVTGLAKGLDGRLWIGTHKGLVCRESNGKLTTYTTDDGLARDWIRAVHVDQTGIVWIGFWEGSLQRMDQDTFTTVSAFGDADVNWFHEDASGVLLIGSNRGLYKWQEDKLQRVRDPLLDELPTISFTACYEDAEGDLWLGTDGGGLCRYAHGRFSNWTADTGCMKTPFTRYKRIRGADCGWGEPTV